MLLAKNLPLPATNRKLAPRYVGPYVIRDVLNPAAVRLCLPASLKIHPVFHVSQLKPVASSPLSPPALAPPPPRVLKGGDMVWEVNEILAVRRRGRGFQFLVDWVGYGPEDRCWVPRSYLADPALLRDFYRRNPRAVGRSPGVSRREGGPVGISGSSRDPQASQPGINQVNRVSIRLVSNTCAGRADYKRPTLSNLQCLNVLNQAGTSSDEPFATTLLKVID